MLEIYDPYNTVGFFLRQKRVATLKKEPWKTTFSPWVFSDMILSAGKQIKWVAFQGSIEQSSDGQKHLRLPTLETL